MSALASTNFVDVSKNAIPSPRHEKDISVPDEVKATLTEAYNILVEKTVNDPEVIKSLEDRAQRGLMFGNIMQFKPDTKIKTSDGTEVSIIQIIQGTHKSTISKARGKFYSAYKTLDFTPFVNAVNDLAPENYKIFIHKIGYARFVIAMAWGDGIEQYSQNAFKRSEQFGLAY